MGKYKAPTVASLSWQLGEGTTEIYAATLGSKQWLWRSGAQL